MRLFKQTVAFQVNDRHWRLMKKTILSCRKLKSRQQLERQNGQLTRIFIVLPSASRTQAAVVSLRENKTRWFTSFVPYATYWTLWYYNCKGWTSFNYSRISLLSCDPVELILQLLKLKSKGFGFATLTLRNERWICIENKWMFKTEIRDKLYLVSIQNRMNDVTVQSGSRFCISGGVGSRHVEG